MSIARFGRTLWRGVQKAIKTTATHTQATNGVPSLKQSQVICQHARTAFDFKNFAAHARRNAVGTILQRNRTRFALYSFVGFQLIGSEKEERGPDLSFLLQAFKGGFNEETENQNEDQYPSKISEYEILERRGKPSSAGAVYNAEHKGERVAVKMMFNVDHSSNASNEGIIMQKFEREYKILGNFGDGPLVLDEHPNIIKFMRIFVDNTVKMEDSLESYPYMMPKQIFPDGIGRNKTLYLIMPQYTNSLRSYLEINKHVSHRTRLNLLCQLCEGAAHLERNKISHRDLKADNILVKESSPNETPELVIIDFGSSFNGQNSDMKLPFPSEYTDRGGNPALMAPEILHALPGYNKVLDYSKADAWAVGAISYEIFGYENPLYTNAKYPDLSSGNIFVDLVVEKLLTEDPNDRFSANDASILLCLLYYHFPINWLMGDSPITLVDVNKWLLKVAFETCRKRNNANEFKLFKTMVLRTTAEEILISINKLCLLYTNNSNNN